MNEEEFAARLYGATTTAAGDAPAIDPSATTTADDATGGSESSGKSVEVTGLDLVRSDPERKFYSAEAMHGAIYDEMTATEGIHGGPHDLAPVEGVDRKEFAEIVADHGATVSDAREFLQDYRDFMQAKLTDAEKKDFLADAIKGMKEKYGDGWEGAWDAANALAKRDPRVAKMLVESGLGADRRTVIRFAEEALRQRASGRLK